MNIYFCAREDLACGTHNRNKPTLTLSCRGYVKSLKHNHRSCAISIFIFKSILFACEIEYLDTLNSSRCDHRHNHFSSFLHLITGGLVRDVPLCLPHLILVIPPDTGKLSSVATVTSFVFALQMSIIAQICSSSFNIVRALIFLSFQVHVKTSPLNIILPWRFF